MFCNPRRISGGLRPWFSHFSIRLPLYVKYAAVYHGPHDSSFVSSGILLGSFLHKKEINDAIKCLRHKIDHRTISIYAQFQILYHSIPNSFQEHHDDVIKWKHFPRNCPYVREFTGPGEFSTQRPVTRSFEVFFDLRVNKRLSKQPWVWWFETLSWSLWRQCKD